ncbi:unnamed protein product [Echinostoma caproni]|uniref:Ig-like domain-containing protein n=1 Tax=Echinostoma caproni TaxID=27848 RepID=A0A183B2R2_9TREM|nr:unnamed protein product [Echinostoma caproni]
MMCLKNEPYKIGWVFNDPQKYLDCSAIPSIIDLTIARTSYRFCTHRLRLQTPWIAHLELMNAFVFDAPNCMIDPPAYNFHDGILYINETDRPPIGAAQVECDGFIKRIYFVNPPNRTMEIELPQRRMYDVTTSKPRFAACIRWSDQSECDSNLTWIDSTCELDALGALSTGWYNVTCSANPIGRKQVFAVMLYNASDVLIICKPGPLVLDKNEAHDVVLCGIPDELNLNQSIPKEITCQAKPDHLSIQSGVLNIRLSLIKERHYEVVCQTASNSPPIHIFFEKLEQVTHIFRLNSQKAHHMMECLIQVHHLGLFSSRKADKG